MAVKLSKTMCKGRLFQENLNSQILPVNQLKCAFMICENGQKGKRNNNNKLELWNDTNKEIVSQ